ncbi:MAG: potassium channel protein [Rhodothermales bacterium]|nr:potassium channel protein [Rhodothermales bacterium]
MLFPISRKIRVWLLKADPVLREIIAAGVFLILLFAIGALGYHLIEGWSWLDGVYMTFITLTTIGFEEVGPLSPSGRIFTIAIAGVGIGAVAFIATRTAQFLLTNQALATRRMNARIGRLTDHYIICGFGRIGSRIAEDLARAKTKFLVIDSDPAKIELANAEGYINLLGDAELDDTIITAGIRSARGLILTLPEDSSNVFVTLSARELNPSLFIMVRTDTQANQAKLKRAGANKVIAAYDIGADRMANVILRPNVNRFLEEMLQSDDFDLRMDEVPVKEGSLLAGKTLLESRFRNQYGAIVMAVLQSDGQMVYNPIAETVLNAGDTLIVVGTEDTVGRLAVDSRRARRKAANGAR